MLPFNGGAVVVVARTLAVERPVVPRRELPVPIAIKKNACNYFKTIFIFVYVLLCCWYIIHPVNMGGIMIFKETSPTARLLGTGHS